MGIKVLSLCIRSTAPRRVTTCTNPNRRQYVSSSSVSTMHTAAPRLSHYYSRRTLVAVLAAVLVLSPGLQGFDIVQELLPHIAVGIAGDMAGIVVGTAVDIVGEISKHS